MREDILKELEKDIKRTEMVLQVKRMMLQRARHPSKPFIGAGKGYFKFIALLSSPFARIHDLAVKAYVRPEEYIADKAIIESMKILRRCQKIKDSKSKLATRMSLIAAEMRLILEQFGELEGYQKSIDEMRDLLQTEIDRLHVPRGAQDEETRQALEEFRTFTTNIVGQTFPNGSTKRKKGAPKRYTDMGEAE